ncbi:MAG: calcium/sodium antiporter [Alphaproteobacteria bacterium]|nr:calcium/sodium antiporter [Alphaproteobacteria bacterium]
MSYALLFLGFVFLVKGADVFVNGASALARLFGVSPTVIGLTVAAIGTSAPEIAVSVTSALQGNGDIALSNAIGSNLFNILLILGLCAVVRPVPSDRGLLRFDIPVCIATTVFLQYMLSNGAVERHEGVLLLTGLGAYLAIALRSAIKNKPENPEKPAVSFWKSGLYILSGLAAVVYGGNLVVANACRIAETMGVSQTLIGLTIVAVGTSLPELVTSVAAARKGETGLAIGNVIGSNLFNILLVVGSAVSLSPVSVSANYTVDCLVLLAASVLIYIFSRTHHTISRAEGVCCLLIYAIYTGYIIVR